MQQPAVMKTSDVIRKLIRGCADDQHTLLHESKLVDAARAPALTRLARERGRFVTDLARLADCEHPHDGSWTELSREAGRDLWVVAAGRNNGDAIASCRHSQSRTEALYDEALQAPWPDETMRVLSAHRRRIHDEIAELHELER